MEKDNITTVLLADDSNTFLMYVGILIKRLGFKTYLARDGVEAIKMAKEKKPSIIVLDYIMPKVDGTSCMNIIRQDPDLKNTPVIVLTSRGEETVQAEFEKLGCCHFLRKPVNISEFYSAIRKCLKFEEKALIQRKNIRTLFNLKVFIKCADEMRELSASTISAEGMFLRTVAPFKVGTKMDIVFNVDSEDPVELQGEVIYLKELTDEIEQEPGMGIKFLEVPEDIKSRIKSFIMNEIANDLIIGDKDIDKEIGFE